MLAFQELPLSISISCPSMATPKTSLKLLIDKKGQRVLFAEATKEFIDFLFHIFSLPLGALIKLLGSNQIVVCLGKLKDSVESFNEAYLQPGIKKDDIINAKTPYKQNAFLFSNAPSVFHSVIPKPIFNYSSALDRSSLFGGNSSPPMDHNYIFGANSSIPMGFGRNSYVPMGFGGNSSMSMGVGGNSSLPTMPGGNSSVPMGQGALLSKEKESVDLKKMAGSYVKDVVTYMVMDDLAVTPMSTIYSISLINNLGVKDLSQLEEKIISFGKDEALNLLKASLTNENVLTTVFLQNDHP